MTETTPSDDTRRRARKAKLTARATSLAITALVAAAPLLAAYLLTPDPAAALLALLPLALVLFLFLVVSPVGTLMSAFTMWTGYWVNSCPNCMSVSVDGMETTYARCDECGDELVEVDPVVKEIGVTRYKQGEPDRHYCSLECSGWADG